MTTLQLMETVRAIIAQRAQNVPKDLKPLLAHATETCHLIENTVLLAFTLFTLEDWKALILDVEDLTEIVSPTWKQRYGPKPALPEPGSDAWIEFREDAHAWLAIRAAAQRLKRTLPADLTRAIDYMEREGTRREFLP